MIGWSLGYVYPEEVGSIASEGMDSLVRQKQAKPSMSFQQKAWPRLVAGLPTSKIQIQIDLQLCLYCVVHAPWLHRTPGVFSLRFKWHMISVSGGHLVPASPRLLNYGGTAPPAGNSVSRLL